MLSFSLANGTTAELRRSGATSEEGLAIVTQQNGVKHYNSLIATNGTFIPAKMDADNILCGHINLGTVPANEVTTKHIDFESDFSSTPVVVASLNIVTDLTLYSDVSVLATEATTKGFNLRLLNNTNNDFTATVDWIAISK